MSGARYAHGNCNVLSTAAARVARAAQAEGAGACRRGSAREDGPGTDTSGARYGGSPRGRGRRSRLGAMEIRRVVVVGAGQMGGGIAQVVAASGRDVALLDAQPGATDRALETMRRSLGKLAEKGGPDAEAVLRRISTIKRVGEAGDADLLIEAVVEDAAVKAEVFREADRALSVHAILASNTSSIPIATLA